MENQDQVLKELVVRDLSAAAKTLAIIAGKLDDEESLKLFEVTVHGVKHVLRLIDEDELMRLALRLEMFAHGKHIIDICKHLGDFQHQLMETINKYDEQNQNPLKAYVE